MCAYNTFSLSLSLSVKAPDDKLSPSSSEPTARRTKAEKKEENESNRIPKRKRERGTHTQKKRLGLYCVVGFRVEGRKKGTKKKGKKGKEKRQKDTRWERIR